MLALSARASRTGSFSLTFLTSSLFRGLFALTFALCLQQAAFARTIADDPLKSIYEPAGSLEGNYLSAYIAGSVRDTAAAATFYREALREDPRNGELLERAFVSFLADGAMAEAFKVGEKLLARDPGNNLAQLALGVRDLKDKRYAQARAHFKKGGRGRAADLTATLLSAWSYAGAGQGKTALQTADRLNGERSYNVFRDYHAGLIAELTDNPQEAEKRLKAAYEADSTTLRIVDAYGRLQSRLGHAEAAREVYEGFDRLVPRHPIILGALDALRDGKTLPPFIASAQSGAAEVLYGLGSAGNSQGDELPAIIYLRLGLYLEPAHALALVTLADIYERMKRMDDAIVTFKQIPQDSPIRPSAEVQIGLGLEQIGKGDEAVAHLNALKIQRPDDLEVLMALGNVLRSRKQFTEAAEVYSQALERIGTPDRSHWSLFYFRGSAYERSKQWPKAQADLQKALELVPDTMPNGKAQVLNYLGYSWVDQGMNVDEAFKLLKRAVELAPRDGMILDSLGWGYFRLGRFEEAMRELEKAIDIKPADPVINDHLGDAYWKVGRRLEAKFQWQHAKDSGPEPDDLEKINVKLEKGMDEEGKPAAAEGLPVDPEPQQKDGG